MGLENRVNKITRRIFGRLLISSLSTLALTSCSDLFNPEEENYTTRYVLDKYPDGTRIELILELKLNKHTYKWKEPVRFSYKLLNVGWNDIRFPPFIDYRIYKNKKEIFGIDRAKEIMRTYFHLRQDFWTPPSITISPHHNWTASEEWDQWMSHDLEPIMEKGIYEISVCTFHSNPYTMIKGKFEIIEDTPLK